MLVHNIAMYYESEILKRRKTKKGIEYLVHYTGYPSSMDQWVKASDFKSL